VVISDRESDVLELLMEAHTAKKSDKPSADLLIRSWHNRNVQANNQKGKLHDIVAKSTLMGTISFELQTRAGEKNRQVKQELRSTELIIQATTRMGTRGKLHPVKMTVVHAKEIECPDVKKPVEWFFVTTLDAKNFEDTVKIIKMYLARWEIELYFKAMKSGCNVEEIQLEEASRFYSCLALYMVIAWRILFIMRIGRVQPDISCTAVLSDMEWQIAYKVINNECPSHPPTVSEAVKMIAQIGGYLARKSDGPPGMKNIWRGLAKIKNMEMYHEALSLCNSPPISQ